MGVIDPSKPVEGVPAVKADIRSNWRASAEAQLWSEEVFADRALTTADAHSQTKFFEVDASGGPVTFTLPPRSDFLTTDRRLLCMIRVVDGNNEIAVAAAPGELRSQPGTAGWDPAANPVKLGVSAGSAVETLVGIWLAKDAYLISGQVRV